MHVHDMYIHLVLCLCSCVYVYMLVCCITVHIHVRIYYENLELGKSENSYIIRTYYMYVFTHYNYT